MAYSFQTFTVGQVLMAAQTNQIEVNIRDHVHGVAGVAMATRIAKVTRQTSALLGADPAGWSAMVFDTTVTDNGSFFNTSSPGALIIPANGIYSVAYVSDQASRADLDAIFMLQVNSNRTLSMVKTLQYSGPVSQPEVNSHFRTDLAATFVASINDLIRLLMASNTAGEMITGPLGNTVNSGGRFTSLTINQVG